MKEALFTVTKDQETLIEIYTDGTVLFGEKYNPDEIAKIFWDAVRLAAKEADEADPANWWKNGIHPDDMDDDA